ncbi:sugar phosphate isomerase/epimerase family protein [Variovorax ureilyticus]|uniref:sugar phosphate isomerase/epimerase family protein n=1 Tax=Variovorax ureilyticus TaxID=1836198 RepID=UPI003D66C564
MPDRCWSRRFPIGIRLTKNRDRSGLSDEETSNLAAEFFRSAGDIAASCGVIICLEPNPPRYGANFMTNSAETAAIVRLVNHPAIRMQFDAGSLAINGEDAEQVLDQYFELIGHIHLSEPDLLPIGDGETDHSRAANALHRYLPDTIATIEMLATKEEPHLDSIERAIRVADAQYRQNPVKSPRIQ